MKRRIIALLSAGVLVIGTVAGCGSTAKPENAASEGTEAAAETEAPADAGSAAQEASEAGEEGQQVGMANPWVNITAEEAHEIIPRLFIPPAGAEQVEWLKCEELADADKGIGPMVQLSFMLDGLSFTARAQTGVEEKTDIGGNFVEWTVGPEDETLSNWGGGSMQAQTYRCINDNGYLDQINWYDVEIGIQYSLSTADKDLDGFDIIAVAESMAPPEEEEFMPGSFVEEAAGKETFDSYDDLISFLKKGNGYTYFELEGYKGKLLAVTESTFDDAEGHKAASEATFYGDVGGKIRFVGNAFSDGTDYPIRCDGKVIYSAAGNEFNSEFMNPTGDALIVKDYIHVDFSQSGEASYTGFQRKDNTSEGDDISTDPAEAEKLFNSLVEEMKGKPVMDFTVVE